MADNQTKEARSYNMSRIRSKNTSPEEAVRKFLFSKGLRYRKNDKRYPGHPDIVLPKFKIVIFINGCFGICMRNAIVLKCQKQIKIIGYQN
jgi:DNA mismatch endonuclease (patch repair protein)